MINKKNTNKVAKIAFVGAIALSVMAQPLSTVAHAASTINYSVNPTTLAAPTIDSVTTNSTSITGSGIKNAIVTISAGGLSYKGIVLSDGKYYISIPRQAANSKILATQVLNGQSSATTIVSVAAASTSTNSTTKIASPVVNPIIAGSNPLTGTGIPGAMLHINIDGNYYSGIVGNDGQFSVKIPFRYAGTKIEVSQTFDFKTFSFPTTVIASAEEIQPATPSVNPELQAPVVNPVAAGNTPITGTALPGAMLHIKIDGNYYSGVADKDGQFSVQIPFRYAGTKIEVSQTFNFKTFSLSTTVIAK
ncbi:Ig-like domain-containing protein [Listeria booriae]|uniref:Ig-like domain-containing protein n=1 Tax=Listeria booriae TaxID=1552123 RepID=UPI001623D2BF|nr:Ig-like domain-containing protein [Listeria booriae]MBC2148308.1 hypothetical protein [Listeria booriae]